MGLLDGLVGQIAAQALGGGQQQNNPLGGALGGMLGNMLGGNANAGGGLGGLLGSVLGGGQAAAPQQQTGGFGGIPPQVLMAALPLVLGWIQKQGGLGGVLNSLTQSGLGQQAQSWIGTGDNQAVDPAHMANVFGHDQIAQIAAQAGVNSSVVSQGLSQLLPAVVNQLTPAGNTQHAADADNEIGQVLGALSGLLK